MSRAARAVGGMRAGGAARRHRPGPGLDPEADVPVPAREAAGAGVDQPRPWQDAVVVLEEAREQRARAGTGDRADGQQDDPVAALGDGEAPDVVVVEHAEVGRALPLRRRRGRVDRPLHLECGSAAAERLRGRVEPPAAAEPAVVVLEELAEELGCVRAGERVLVQHRYGVGPRRELQRADLVEVQHLERARAGRGRLCGRARGRDGQHGHHDRESGEAPSPHGRQRSRAASRRARPASARRPAGGSPAAGAPGRGRSPAPRPARAGRGARPSPPSMAGSRRDRIADSVRSWMSITQSGTGGACMAMSRAISSRLNRLRISETTVELRVACAIARWNLRSSWRKRSSWREHVVARGQLALALDQGRHRGEVLLARVHSRELRHARLEQPACLEHARHLAHADLLPALQQLARDQLGLHEDPAGLAPAHLEHAGLHQHLDRLAQRRAADPHPAPRARARTAGGRRRAGRPT